MGGILVAIAVGIIAFVIALIVGAIFHLGTLVAYAGLIGLAVAIIYYFTRPHNPVV